MLVDIGYWLSSIASKLFSARKSVVPFDRILVDTSELKLKAMTSWVTNLSLFQNFQLLLSGLFHEKY